MWGKWSREDWVSDKGKQYSGGECGLETLYAWNPIINSVVNHGASD